MEVVLADLVWKRCFIYLDDFLVCSKSFDEHLQHLRSVFDRIRDAGLRLKPEKCLFIREEVPYLGHIVSKEGIIPDPAKTQKVKEYPVPEDQIQLTKFLGLSSYYRRFVPGFAKLASPVEERLHLPMDRCIPEGLRDVERTISNSPSVGLSRIWKHPLICAGD